MLGTTLSYGAGGNDFWFVKTNASGAVQWSHAYGGSGQDEGWRFVQTSDGGYVLTGATTSYGAGSYDFWLVKIDAVGNVIWSRTFGGAADDHAACVIQTLDGGFAVGGHTYSYGAGGGDYWLVKTDANGNMLWNHTYGGPYLDDLNYIVQTSDGGYALAGFSLSYGAGAQDIWLVKTDANGTMLWNHTYGGTADENCWGVEQTADGGYVLGGQSMSYTNGAKDMWMVKTNANGIAQWNRHFGGSSNDWCNSIHQTWDGGYILAGWTQSFGAGSLDLYMVKTDVSGNALWTRTYGGTGWDQITTVRRTSDDGYVALGWTNTWGAGQEDFWLVKTAVDHTLPVELTVFDAVAVGRTIDVRFSTATEINVSSFEIWRSETADGAFAKIAELPSQGNSSTQHDYHFADRTVREGHTYWYYLVDVDANGARTEHRDRMASATATATGTVTDFTLSAYPNPFNPSTTLTFTLPEASHVKVRVYDCTGRLVVDLADAGFQAGEHRLTLSGGNLPIGVYLARLETPTLTLTHKLLLVK